MRLSKIKLCGFKSFVDPTTVDLRGELIGIVGPNGCGKSNIIDAVRWVMGESSAKTLRGDSMTDVIFNGAETRKPVGQASVELVFDNSDKTLIGEYASYSEISIKRLVNREAQSTYFLNGSRCRRRDITDVFLGTGLGPRSYSIIEQGMISRFIEARPDDLRLFLEEAAGISKYKERRRETENRMQHTRENLARISDICDELQKQLVKLEQQAQTAQKFKEYKSKEHVLRAELHAIRLRDIDITLHDHQTRVRALELLQAEQHALLSRVNTDIELSRQAHVGASDAFLVVQKQFYDADHEITRLEQSMAHEKQKHAALAADLKQVLQDIEEGHDSLAADRELIAELMVEIERLEPLMASAQTALHNASFDLKTSESNMASIHREWEAFNQQSHASTQKAEVSQTHIQHIEKQMKASRDKITQLDEMLKTCSTGTLEAHIAALETSFTEKNAALSSSKLAVSEIITEITAARANNQVLTQRANHSKSTLQTLRAQQASLETLQKAATGQSDATVLPWLREHTLDHYPRLVQVMQVDALWSSAVERVLGHYLEAVCVESLEDMAGYLGTLNEGNLTLLQKGLSPAVKADTLLAKVASDYNLSDFLGHIYCANSLEEALHKRTLLTAGESVVTNDGLWFGQNWLCVMHKTSDTSGAIAREQALLVIAEDILCAQAAVTEDEHALQTGIARLTEIEAERDALQKVVNEQNAGVSDVSAALKIHTARLASMHDRITTLTTEREEHQKRLEQLHTDREDAKSAWSSAIAAMQEAKGAREALLARKEHCQAQLLTCRASLDTARQTRHEYELRLQTNRSQAGTLKQGLLRLEDRLTQLQKRQAQCEHQGREDEKIMPQLETQLQASLTARLTLESELTQAKAVLSDLEARLSEHEANRENITKLIDHNRHALEEQRLALQTLTVRKQTVIEKLEEMHVSLEEITRGLPEAPDVVTWEAELELMERRIARLGAINLAAIEEYQTETERKTYLDAQQADLQEALTTLETAIAKIDKETKDRFKDTYNTVNGAFQTLFPKIFGGGAAYLELTGEDLLDTGVSVMAQPPGKRNSTIHLLSGGEKALTAIALVFSIFQLNPSPFCILDEVDAPLDDANVVRFCNLVKEMKKKVQFMFISHNKIAIEMSEQLVGVTMKEAGVSRLVAVDIDEAIAMAAV